jgi:RNA polymerase sigma factor (sigma-70 family)
VVIFGSTRLTDFTHQLTVCRVLSCKSPGDFATCENAVLLNDCRDQGKHTANYRTSAKLTALVLVFTHAAYCGTDHFYLWSCTMPMQSNNHSHANTFTRCGQPITETPGTKEFGELAAKLRGFLMAIAICGLKHVQDAEDLVQDTLVKIWKRLLMIPQKGQINDLKALARTIIRQAIIDIYRKKQRRTEALYNEVSLDEDMDIVDSSNPNDSAFHFADLIAFLPQQIRVAVTLYYVHGMSTGKIGELLGHHRGTIWNWVDKAKKHICHLITVNSTNRIRTTKATSETAI